MVGAAGAATDEDLAFANFGASAELLLEDFYSQALEAKVVRGPGVNALRQGRSAAARHARALCELLAGAGDTPPLEEDFAFAWPRTARSRPRGATVTTGLGVLRALLGAYQTAAASASVPDYRVLYASLAASARPADRGPVRALAARAGCEPFPVATDLETASAALEPVPGLGGRDETSPHRRRRRRLASLRPRFAAGAGARRRSR